MYNNWEYGTIIICWLFFIPALIVKGNLLRILCTGGRSTTHNSLYEVNTHLTFGRPIVALSSYKYLYICILAVGPQ